MSVVRSPTRSGLTGRSDSQPNLFVDDHKMESIDSPKPTFRNKRKLSDNNDHIRNELSEMRQQMSQMMVMLTALTTSQNEFMEKITEDINTIKNQMCNIKLATENLASEQNAIKCDLNTLRNDSKLTEKKVIDLQKKVEELKPEHDFSSYQFQENAITEIKEREFRSKNIVINGIPEPQSLNREERMSMDKKEVNNILKKLNQTYPEPKIMFRLGKFNANKTRPIKVCFNSQEVVKSILRKRKDIDIETIKIYSDQTPQQQKYLKNLKDELKRRLESGQKDLGIKYINSVPRIIELLPKNGKISHSEANQS
ncbi:unnamed protein product [Euphydryas editha]|uniref:Uncharacterized protein n=1 Tax=Euphydryas editha TaxID=104508 RepID=A0AAU9TNB5_EUPED|nr:unnamed protein product [Euphydryas editha]